MANIGKWSVQAGVNADGFTSGMQKMVRDSQQADAGIGTNLNNIKGRFTSFQSSLGQLSSLATGFFGGVVANLGLESFKKLGDAMEHIGERAREVVGGQRRLREEFSLTRTEAAAVFQLSREMGIDQEQLRGSLSTAARHVGELRANLREGGSGGAAGTALRRMGLDPTSFANLNTVEQLATAGDHMHRIANAADRAAAMTAIFGRGWRENLPLLERGSRGLRDAGGRAFTATAEQEELIRFQQRADRAGRGRLAGLWDEITTRLSAGSGAAILGLAGGQSLAEMRRREAAARAAAIAAGAAFGASSGGHISVRDAEERKINEAATGGDLAATLLGVRSARLAALGGSRQEVTDSLETRIGNLREETAVMGMTANQAERFRFAMRGATEEQLRGLEVWQRARDLAQEWQQSIQEANQLRGANRGPFSEARDDLTRMIAARQQHPELFREEDYRRNVGARIRQLAGNLGESAMLGSLDANSSDTAAIIQARAQPQVDELAAIRASLEAQRELLRRTAVANERIARAFDNGELNAVLGFSE